VGGDTALSNGNEGVVGGVVGVVTVSFSLFF